ncbi:MAG: MFS transporter [Chloroflexi bacterium]|nr:MAG: MFS transporter [Chloroflexota bacterium]
MYLKVLKENPNFRYLWLAQVISLLGDWFNTIALSVLVAEYSNGSGLAISLFLMARFLSPLIVSPFAGVIVDKFDRKKILIYCNLLRTGVVLMFLLATTPDTLWLIYLLTILQFTLSALFEPGQSAIMPSVVKRENLVIANTLSGITWSAMLALGAIVGGVVASQFGTATALIIDAMTFALAGWLIAQIKITPEAKTIISHDDHEHHESGSFMDGLRYLARNPATIATLLIKGGGSIGNVDLLMTVMATQLFAIHGDSQLPLGIMYSAFGVGAIAGPLLFNRFNDGSVPRMRYLVAFGFFLEFLGWVVLGSIGSLTLVSIAFIIRAMGGSANWVYSTVIIQKSVPDRYLGRVFALDMAIFQFATVASTLIHGSLVDILNQRTSQPLLMLQETTWESQIRLINYTTISHNLSLIAYGTALVSLIPLILWLIALRYAKQRKLQKAQNEYTPLNTNN